MIKGFVKKNNISKYISNLSKELDEGVKQALSESALLVHRLAIKEVSANQGGDSAIRYNPKRNVTVSKPGEAPHTDTGRLRQSIKFDLQKDKALIGSNLKYAKDLEFGTQNMKPRPWLSTAVEKASLKIGDLFNTALNKKVKASK